LHILAAGTALVLVGLSLLHIYWAVAGGTGAGVVPEVNGAPVFHPGRAATWLVAAALASAGLLVWEAGGAGPEVIPRAIARWGAGIVAVVFLARAIGDFHLVGFFKRVRATRFGYLDTRVYSPLCVAIGLASGAIALVAAP
jgi:hypothetical protein